MVACVIRDRWIPTPVHMPSELWMYVDGAAFFFSGDVVEEGVELKRLNGHHKPAGATHTIITTITTTIALLLSPPGEGERLQQIRV